MGPGCSLGAAGAPAFGTAPDRATMCTKSCVEILCRFDVGAFFKNLISRIRRDYKNNYSVLIAPGPNEIKEAEQFNAKIVMKNGESIDIKTLVSLISSAKFVIANDTGPAHIASHLKKKGLALFGSHTSAKKVSIENYNFKALTVKNLKDLSVDMVLKEIKPKLN